MPSTLILSDPSGPIHAVRFYKCQESLAQTVADFIGDEGLALGDPAIILVTPPQRKAILDELRSRGFDVEHAIAAGDLVVLDAEETLATLVVDGVIDEMRFRTLVPASLEGLRRGRRNCTIRAYGEMVHLLWQAGQADAAIRLEALWNEVAPTYDLWILCGYAATSVYTGRGVEDICGQHTHVIGRTPFVSPSA